MANGQSLSFTSLDPHVSNELIIKFKGDINLKRGKGKTIKIKEERINKLNNELGGVICERILISNPKGGSLRNLSEEPLLYKFQGNQDVALLIHKLLNSGFYEAVELNYLSKKTDICTKQPNDFMYNIDKQWGLENNGSFDGNATTNDADIDMEMGWGITTGNSNVVVAIIDGGTKLNHSEFIGRIWVNSGEIAGNGIDDDGNGSIDDINGWDFVNSDNDPSDDGGHGTIVAGVIGATGNNGFGFAGVDWNCKLMTCKVMNSAGTGTLANAISGVYYAVDNGADVINMSILFPGFTTIFETAIDYAYNNNVVPVAATGNDNTNVIGYPAGYSNCIAVGATDVDNKRANPFSGVPTSGSNYGTHMDLVAPGNDIYGLTHLFEAYNTLSSGTSLAAPLVAGVVSLLKGLDSTLSPDSIRTILRNSAVDQLGDPSEDTPGWDQYHGYGLLNAYNALKEFAIERDTVTICKGLDYTFPDGGVLNNVTVSHIDTSIILSSSPCDRTIITMLFVDTNVLAHTTDTIICFGDSIVLNGSGASIYSWDNGVIDGVAFAPFTTTIYTVAGNVSGICNTDQITIIVNPLPNVTANISENNICIGNEIALYGSGSDANYIWDNGVSDNLSFPSSLSTLYTVLGTDSNNCVSSDTITVFVSANSAPDLDIIASDTNICEGDIVTLSGNGALTYGWNNGVSDGVSFSLDSSSTFFVTGTDVNGCSDTASINIIVDTVFVNANVSSIEICSGDFITLTGTGSVSNYTWNNGAIDGVSFSLSTSTLFTVAGTGLGCTTIDTVSVFVNPVPVTPTIITNRSEPFCSGDSLELSIIPQAAVSYCWEEISSQKNWEYVGATSFTGGTISSGMDLAFNKVTDEPYVAYVDQANGNKISVMKYDGTVWGVVGNVGFSDGAVYRATIAFHPTTNEPYVAYRDDANGHKVSVMRFNGSSWVDVGINGFSQNNISYVRLAFHSITGEPSVAVSNGVSFSVYKFDGNGWLPIGLTGVGGAPNYTGLSFVIDPITGGPIVSYANDNNSDKTEVMKFDGNSWVYVGAQGFSNAVSYNTSLAINPLTNEIYIAYYDQSNQEGLVMKFNGTNWVTVGSAYSESYSSNNRLKFNSKMNEPYVAFIDGNYQNQIKVKRYDGVSWALVGKSNLDIAVNYQHTTALDFSSNNSPYVLYSLTGGFPAVIKYDPPCLETQNTYSTSYAGSYSVRVTNTYGCSTTSSNQVVINQTPTVIAVASPSSSICFGDTLTLIAQGCSPTYSWNNGVTNEVSFVPGGSNTYVVTNIDTNNCFSTDTISVTVNTLPNTPTITTNNPIDLCTGDSVILSVTPESGINYCWGEINNLEDWIASDSLGMGSGSPYSKIIKYHPITNEPYIAFEVGNNIGVSVIKRGVNGWEYVGMPANLNYFNGGNVYSYSFAFNPITNEPYVAFTGQGPTNVIHVMKLDGSSWVNVGVSNFNTKDYANHVSLAFYPGTSTPYVAFYEGGNNGSGATTSLMKFNGIDWKYVGPSSYVLGDARRLNHLELKFNPCTKEPYVSYSLSLSEPNITVFNGLTWQSLGTTSFYGQGTAATSFDFHPITNEPYVAYIDVLNLEKIVVSKFNGTIWELMGDTLSSVGTTKKPKILFNPGTFEPYVSFYDEGDLSVQIKKLVNNNWESIGNGIYGSREYNYSPNLAFDNTNQLGICVKTSTYNCHVFNFSSKCMNDSNVFNVNAAGTYQTTGINSFGCKALSTNSITIKQSPVVLAKVSNPRICFGDSVILEAIGTAQNYIWNSGIIDSALFQPNGTSTYAVTGIDSTACISTDSVTIIVDSVPSQPTVFSSDMSNLCSGQNILSITPDVGVDYCWTDTSLYSWSHTGPVGISNAGTGFVSMAINPITHESYVSFNESGGATVKRFDGTNWVIVGSANMNGTGSAYHSLKFNPITFEPYLAFRDGSTHTSVMKFNGIVWEYVGSSRFSEYRSEYIDLAFNPQTNEPYVAYSDDDVSDKTTVMRFDGEKWVLVGVQGFSVGTARYQSLAFHPITEEPYLAYQDNSNGGHSTVMKFDGLAWQLVGGASFSTGAPTSSSGSKYQRLVFHPTTFEPHVACDEGWNGTKVFKFDGTTWQVYNSTGFSSVNPGYQDLAFHPLTNEIYVANYEGVKKFNGISWENLAIIELTNGYLGSSFTVKLDMEFHPSSHELHVAYRNSAEASKAGVMKLSPTCFSTSDTLAADSAGTYGVVASYSNGCYSNSTNMITINETPAVETNFTPSDTLCLGDSLMFYSTGTADSYVWSGGVVDSALFVPTSSGTYTLVGNNLNGCTDSASVPIIINPLPAPFAISATGATTICDGDSVLLYSSSTGTTNCWHPANLDSWINVGLPECSQSSSYNNIVFHPATNEPYVANGYNVMKFNGITWDNVGNQVGGMSNIVFEPVTNIPYIVSGSRIMKLNGNIWEYVGSNFVTSSWDTPVLKFHPVTNEPYIAYRDIVGSSFNNGGIIVVKNFDGSNWQYVGGGAVAPSYAYSLDFEFNPITHEPYIVYNGSEHGSQLLGPNHVWKYNGFSWNQVGNVFNAGMPGCTKQQSLAFNPTTGQPYVAFENGNGPLSVMTYQSNSWVLIGETHIANGDDPEIKIHPITNEPYLSYNTTLGLSQTVSGKSVRKFNGNNWEPVGELNFSAGSCSSKNLEFHPITMEPYVAFRDTSLRTTVMKFNSECVDSGDSLYVYQSGSYELTVSNSYGCPTTSSNQISVNVNSLPNVTGSILPLDTVCQGDTVALMAGGIDSYSYLWNNNVVDSIPFLIDSSTTYILTGTDTNNCFGYDTVSIVVNQTYSVLDIVIVCLGESFTLPGGSSVLSSGIYEDTLSSIFGCDSIITTNLTFSNSLYSNDSNSICQGLPFVLPDGDTTYLTGSYIDTIPSFGGCDSIITSHLTVNPIFFMNQNDSICQSDSILLYGNYITTAGTYYDSLQTITGCDSVLSTTLFVNSIFTLSENISICFGDSLLLYGSYESLAGTYYDSLQTINGCDSILLTTLAINPLPIVTLANFNSDTLCITESAIGLPIGSPSGGIYTGAGVSSGNFDPSTAGVGVHDIIYTYTDGNSCLNSDTTVVTIDVCTGIDNARTDFGIIIYPNPSTGKFTIEKPGDLNKVVEVRLLDASSKLIVSKTIQLGQQKVEMDITDYSKGVYFLQLIVDKEVFVKQILKD